MRVVLWLCVMTLCSQLRSYLDLQPGSCIFFFGCRHKDKDFLYGSLFQGWVEQGLLTDLIVAFSRDQPDKVYVQDKLQEAGAVVYPLLFGEGKGTFYVSGSARQMPASVRSALVTVCAQHGMQPLHMRIGSYTELLALQAVFRMIKQRVLYLHSKEQDDT